MAVQSLYSDATLDDELLAVTRMDATYTLGFVADSVPDYENGYAAGFTAGGAAHADDFANGQTAGELRGFSSQRNEVVMRPITPGETNVAKKTISFRLYDSTGAPASGLAGEGVVLVPSSGQVQTNRDLAGYEDALGTFSHVGDGNYRYVFDDAELASGLGEGNIWFRVKAPGFRTEVLQVPVQYLKVDHLATTATAEMANALLDALLEDHATIGSVADGIAIAAGLLQGNFMMDNVDNSNAFGQTAARLRVWRSAAAMAGALPGDSGLQGAFAAFSLTTTYEGAGKITMHKAVRTT